MCQFFWVPAGVKVEEDKLRASTIVNPHGYGLIYRPKPEGEGPWPFEKIQKVEKGVDNDPDEIVRLMNEEYLEYDRLLHLRYVTAGEMNEENVHPFLVLEKGKGQLWLAHNGTLYSFKPTGKDTRSDTKIFCEEFVKSLLEPTKKPFSFDSNAFLLKEILAEKVTGSNRIILLSSYEKNVFLFNYSKFYYHPEEGKEKGSIEEYSWLAANEYSFDENHRKPKTTTYTWKGGVFKNWGDTYNTVSKKKEEKKEEEKVSKEQKTESTPQRNTLSSRVFKSHEQAQVWARKRVERFRKKVNFDQVYPEYSCQNDGSTRVVIYGVNHPKTNVSDVIKKETQEIKKPTLEELEAFSKPGTTLTGGTQFLWPPTKEHMSLWNKETDQDEYVWELPEKVCMFFGVEAIDDLFITQGQPLYNIYGIKKWLVENRKHFTTEDVADWIKGLQRIILSLITEKEILEERLLRLKEDQESYGMYHQYGLY